MTHHVRLHSLIRLLPPLLLPPLLVVAACDRSEDPPAIPSGLEPTGEQETRLELEPEDAGVETPDASPKGKAGRRRAASSLAMCCAALRQNAESSPQKDPMLMAASACEAAVKSGSAAAVKATVAPFAQGVPAGCL